MGLPKTTTSNPVQGPANLSGGNGVRFSDQLLEKARADTDTVLKELGSQLDGLSEVEAASRLKQYGPNGIAREKRQSALMRLLDNVKNPLVILLTALGVLSFLTGDLRAMVVIFVMVLLGVVLRFFQEMRADDAAEKLKAMVSSTATLVRGGKEQEVSLKLLVPGDIIRLAAGDMAPADVRVLSAKDQFLNARLKRCGSISHQTKMVIREPSTRKMVVKQHMVASLESNISIHANHSPNLWMNQVLTT